MNEGGPLWCSMLRDELGASATAVDYAAAWGQLVLGAEILEQPDDVAVQWIRTAPLPGWLFELVLDGTVRDNRWERAEVRRHLRMLTQEVKALARADRPPGP